MGKMNFPIYNTGTFILPIKNRKSVNFSQDANKNKKQPITSLKHGHVI